MDRANRKRKANTVRCDEPNESLIHYEINRLRDRLSLTSKLVDNNINMHKKCVAIQSAIDHLESAVAKAIGEDIA